MGGYISLAALAGRSIIEGEGINEAGKAVHFEARLLGINLEVGGAEVIIKTDQGNFRSPCGNEYAAGKRWEYLCGKAAQYPERIKIRTRNKVLLEAVKRDK